MNVAKNLSAQILGLMSDFTPEVSYWVLLVLSNSQTMWRIKFHTSAGIEQCPPATPPR
jgi:hypothetical protein